MSLPARPITSIFSVEFTKLKVIVMRTLDPRSGDLSSRLRIRSQYNLGRVTYLLLDFSSACVYYKGIEMDEPKKTFHLDYSLT